MIDGYSKADNLCRLKRGFVREVTPGDNGIITQGLGEQAVTLPGSCVNEGNEISEFQYESEMRMVRIWRVRVIMKSEQISKNIITAIGTITLSLVTYRYNKINWNLTEHKEK